MSKLTTSSLFELDNSGMITKVRGIQITAGSNSVRVLSENERFVPPKETSWVLEGAYLFAQGLRESPAEDDVQRETVAS